MDYVNFATFENESDPASNRASNPCRYSSAVVEQLTCNQQVPSSTLGGGTNHFNDLQGPAVLIFSRLWRYWWYRFFTAIPDSGRSLRPWLRLFKHVCWLQLSWAKFQAKRFLFFFLKLKISQREMLMVKRFRCSTHCFTTCLQTSIKQISNTPEPQS